MIIPVFPFPLICMCIYTNIFFKKNGKEKLMVTDYT